MEKYKFGKSTVSVEEAFIRNKFFDHLTKLPNMTYFFELAEIRRWKLLKSGKKAAFLFFNLVGMKLFNVRYGFAEGNKLLRSTAQILADYFGAKSCSRFAQDHFVVLTDSENVEETLRYVFDKCKVSNGGKNLPVRVGIFLDQNGNSDIGTSCDRAKYACDRDKDAHISGFRYFSEEMLILAENQQYIIDNLDRAIEGSWIKVYYQPIVRASNGKVCDEEALARWIDPVKGFLSPGDFIPVLEDAGLIYKLDLYVLDKILDKLRIFQNSGIYMVPHSLNLSRADFDALDIVEEIRKRVDAAGLPHEKLTIEITESVIGKDFEFMKEQITRFQELGFKVWMDDFGSGYSSLDLLQNIRFDLIKFDMRFMQQFTHKDESRIILTELVKMAFALGIDTVTEGVETEEQVIFLKEIGCSKLQGFYYCKPIPVESIIQRNENGTQIGFENPDESEYYAAIGKINLYDLAILAHNDQEDLQRYFKTIPMAVLEVEAEKDIFRITRYNKSYKEYIEKTFHWKFNVENVDLSIDFGLNYGKGSAFIDAMVKCARDGNIIVLDENVGDNATTHSIIKRISVNPVTGTAALIVAVLAVTEHAAIERIKQEQLYYARVMALSDDYICIYIIDMNTDDYAEYSASGDYEALGLAKDGSDFFDNALKYSVQTLYYEDRELFAKSFSKRNIIEAVERNRRFVLKYRLMIDDEPVRVTLKAAIVNEKDGSKMIIGVTRDNIQEVQL